MKIKQILNRRITKIIGGTVLALALFLLLVPVGAKYYLADWLEKNGADSATISKLRFNPFAGRVSLAGMDVQLGGRSILHNASMVLDLGITSLFHRDIRVEKAEYHDLSIDLEQFADGSWRFGSYTVQGKRQENPVESGQDVASAWNFLADQVQLFACSVRLKTPDLEMTLVIDEAELSRFSTRDDLPAGSFTFRGKLDDGPINLRLDTVQLVPEFRLEGTVLIAAFQLEELSGLLGDLLSNLTGKVGLDGRLLFLQTPGKDIEVNYDGSIGITALDIAAKDLSVIAENFDWKGKLHYGRPETSPQHIDTDGSLALHELSLSLPAAELVYEQTLLELSGKSKVTLADTVAIENDGSLLLEGIELALPPLGIVEERISWKGVVVFDSDHEKQGLFVQSDGLLQLGEFQVGSGDQLATFATGGKNVSWQGVVRLHQEGSEPQKLLELDGTLLGNEFHTTLAEPQLQLRQGQVELKTKSALHVGEGMSLAGLSSLSLQDFTLFEGTNNSPTLSVDRLAVGEIEGRGDKTIAVNNLLTTGLKAVMPGKFPLDIVVPEIGLSDFLTEDLETFTAGSLQVKKPLIRAVLNRKELAGFDKLTVGNISFGEGAQIGVEDVMLENFTFLEGGEIQPKEPAIAIAKANLRDVKWSSEAGFEGNSLQLDQLVARVLRDKDGNISINKQLAEMQLQEEPRQKSEPTVEGSEPAAGTPSQAAPFKLQKAVVTGKSAVYFEDQTLAVPFVTELALSRLELTGLDSSRPEQKTDLVFEGELEKRAPLEITGQLLPFQNRPAVELELELKNYPLASLSAYTIQAVGTALASGQLQLKTEVALANDTLDMKNAILLKKLETKTLSPDLAAELNNQLPIPLDTALSMLRDSERNIKLDIPLSGPLSELNVGISSVLITALSKAIVPAASGYLMYALGPYGALAYVGMKVGEKMLQVELPPVVFVQQEMALTQEHREYLQRIGKILQDRPETDIQICPQVASWEFLTEQQKSAVQGEAIEVNVEKQDQLLTLGQQRAEAVQQHLENEYGIARSRLLICDTKINTEKKAVPQVLLHL